MVDLLNSIDFPIFKFIKYYNKKDDNNDDFNWCMIEDSGIYKYLCLNIKDDNFYIIRYLLDTDIKLKKTTLGLNICANDNLVFKLACHVGNIELVKYLLKNYSEIDIHADNDVSILYAAYKGNIEVVKYLLNNYEYSTDTIENVIICLYGNNKDMKTNYLEYLVNKHNDINIYKCLNNMYITNYKHKEAILLLVNKIDRVIDKTTKDDLYYIFRYAGNEIIKFVLVKCVSNYVDLDKEFLLKICRENRDNEILLDCLNIDNKNYIYKAVRYENDIVVKNNLLAKISKDILEELATLDRYNSLINFVSTIVL